MSQPPVIWESFEAQHVPPGGMDQLWAQGWRHFGTQFFRYSHMEHEGRIELIVPLRVDLAALRLSKGQRRVLRRNADLTVTCSPAELHCEARELFHRHKTRFTTNVPDDLSSFLSDEPARKPCTCLELRCSLGRELVALSWMDVGGDAVSSVYAVFAPEHAARSPGIFTLLCELEWAAAQGRRHAYPGYTTLGPGHYDYKKQLPALEGYDWSSRAWRPWSDFNPADLQAG